MHENHVERRRQVSEAEHLLSDDNDDRMDMPDLSPQETRNKNLSQVGTTYTDELNRGEASTLRAVTSDGDEVALTQAGEHIEYRVYKIRWFGLTQLILLNMVISWDVSIALT